MATFNVKVVVELNYEVEADSADEAEQAGWSWEDYRQFGSVQSIKVDEDESEAEDYYYQDDLSDDAEALASAGHGMDEDY